MIPLAARARNAQTQLQYPSRSRKNIRGGKGVTPWRVGGLGGWRAEKVLLVGHERNGTMRGKKKNVVLVADQRKLASCWAAAVLAES